MRVLCLLLTFLAACATAESETLSAGTSGACQTSADCHTAADYCTGCDCRALSKTQTLPKCRGPGVRCIKDPCQGKSANCKDGACTLSTEDAH